MIASVLEEDRIQTLLRFLHTPVRNYYECHLNVFVPDLVETDLVRHFSSEISLLFFDFTRSPAARCHDEVCGPMKITHFSIYTYTCSFAWRR